MPTTSMPLRRSSRIGAKLPVAPVTLQPNPQLHCSQPPRRSSRITAKPPICYTQTPEVPDEILLARTRGMFDTLLEERINIAKRNFEGVYWKCRDDFFKMFRDLPEDDIERIAAHQVGHKLPAFSDCNALARDLIAKRKVVLAATPK